MPRHSIRIAVSNSHVHLSAVDLDTLFGAAAEAVTTWRGHPKFDASARRVRLVGPRGSLEGLRVLVPPTHETWIELNRTHAFALGVNPPIESGDLPSAEWVTIEGPAGSVTVRRNVVIEARHVELTAEQASAIGVSAGQIARAELGGPRALVFQNVAVRVLAEAREGFAGVLELDRDEANAAMVSHGDSAVLVWD